MCNQSDGRWRKHCLTEALLHPVLIFGPFFAKKDCKTALYHASRQATMLFVGTLVMALNAAETTMEDSFVVRYGKGMGNMALGMFSASLLFDATSAAIRHGMRSCKNAGEDSELERQMISGQEVRKM